MLERAEAEAVHRLDRARSEAEDSVFVKSSATKPMPRR
jgi:hypothetical protein